LIYTSLTSGLFWIVFALIANFNVLWVSSWKSPDGVIVQIIAVLAFPPNDGCKILVNFESL